MSKLHPQMFRIAKKKNYSMKEKISFKGFKRPHFFCNQELYNWDQNDNAFQLK